mgnify:CR=1 FL=1
MKEAAKEWIISAFIGAVIVGLECLTEATLASTFIKENGLMLIVALIAINVATLAAIISIMLNLEQQYNRPYFFDKSKKLALAGVREMLLLGFIFFFLSAVIPETYWQLNFESTRTWEGVLIVITAVISRMCVFQAIYSTYDFSKSIINLTTLPEGCPPPSDEK